LIFKEKKKYQKEKKVFIFFLTSSFSGGTTKGGIGISAAPNFYFETLEGPRFVARRAVGGMDASEAVLGWQR